MCRAHDTQVAVSSGTQSRSDTAKFAVESPPPPPPPPPLLAGQSAFWNGAVLLEVRDHKNIWGVAGANLQMFKIEGSGLRAKRWLSYSKFAVIKQEEVHS